MPNSSDFLHRIVAEPDRDEPRLEYAHWLEGQKDPRGEFIRLQVELARLSASAPEREKLIRREQTLLKKHAACWNGELPAWARHHAPGFYRGFPEVHCTVNDWIHGAPALVKLWPLHRVNMKATADSLLRLTDSAELSRVELLDLSFSPLNDSSLSRLVGSPHLGSLRALYLWRCGLGAGAARAIASSPQLVNLRKLQLEENRITAEGAEALARSASLCNLSALSLRSNHFGPEGGRFLPGAAILERLESLDLGNNDIGSECSAQWFRLAPPHLHRLSFVGNAMGDDGAIALSKAAQLCTLGALDVSYNQIGTEGGRAIAKANQLASLRELLIGANPLGVAGVKAIATSRFFANLEELNLDAAEVGDDGAVALAQSQTLTKLRRLGLWDAKIGNAGADAIAAAPAFETLEQLSLRGNPFAKECRKQLRKRFGKRISM